MVTTCIVVSRDFVFWAGYYKLLLLKVALQAAYLSLLILAYSNCPHCLIFLAKAAPSPIIPRRPGRTTSSKSASPTTVGGGKHKKASVIEQIHLGGYILSKFVKCKKNPKLIIMLRMMMNCFPPSWHCPCSRPVMQWLWLDSNRGFIDAFWNMPKLLVASNLQCAFSIQHHFMDKTKKKWKCSK